jgi:hypothetical protein
MVRLRGRSYVAFVFVPTVPIQDWLQEIDTTIARSPGFFAGRPVVIDAPFSPYLADPHFISTASQRFDWPHVDVEVVLVRVSPETLRQRLRKRGLERDRVKLANWDEYWAEHGGRPCAWIGVRQTEILNDEPEHVA